MIETNETIDEFLARHADDVSEAVRKAAAQEILPRRRRLAAHEVDEKAGPHDLVTDADRKAEQFLTEALSALLPGSVVVGEEAVHANPATYEAIRGEAPVWIVDPVDGTRQFVHGDPGFCTLVALAHHGTVRASWTYAPVHDRMATAVRGQGAFLDGERLHAGPPEPGRELRVATSHPDYTTDEQKHALLGLRAPGVAPGPAARRAWSISRWPAASWTPPRSAGKRPGTTRPACSWWRRRAAPTSPAPVSPSASPATTTCRSPRPATRPRPAGWWRCWRAAPEPAPGRASRAQTATASWARNFSTNSRARRSNSAYWASRSAPETASPTSRLPSASTRCGRSSASGSRPTWEWEKPQ